MRVRALHSQPRSRIGSTALDAVPDADVRQSGVWASVDVIRPKRVLSLILLELIPGIWQHLRRLVGSTSDFASHSRTIPSSGSEIAHVSTLQCCRRNRHKSTYFDNEVPHPCPLGSSFTSPVSDYSAQMFIEHALPQQGQGCFSAALVRRRFQLLHSKGDRDALSNCPRRCSNRNVRRDRSGGRRCTCASSSLLRRAAGDCSRSHHKQESKERSPCKDGSTLQTGERK